MRAIVRQSSCCVVLVCAAVLTLAAQNEAPRIELAELKKLHAAKQVLLVDVRDDQSFAAGHIPGAINIPVGEDERAEHYNRLKAEKRPVVTYCACPEDATSARAAATYMRYGVKDVRVLKNGYGGWLKSGGAVETSPQE
jgi:rhodanese-related sulfurtransferase